MGTYTVSRHNVGANVTRNILKKMILSPILQPSPTKVCHVPMTSQQYILPQLEPCTVISKEIKREKYIYVFIDSTKKWCKGPMMTNVHRL